MSDKVPRKEPKASSSTDPQIKKTGKGSGELGEEELGQVVGGFNGAGIEVDNGEQHNRR
jgi:hypothetical protein